MAAVEQTYRSENRISGTVDGATALDDEPEPLEVDFDWDGDSAIDGMTLRSSTRSIDSSIYDHVVENGRTYHRFKEGKYMLPNDETEQERLDYQHQVYTAVSGGKLCLAPIDEKVKRVLDVGTGTGIWAVEFGLENPGALIIGTDLSPIQPNYTPPNVSFEICDAEDEWTFQLPFDFIHMRAMITCFKNPATVLASAYAALAPGGYIELRDPILPFHFLTPPPDGPRCALKEWGEKLVDASSRAGRDWTAAARYSEMLRDLGFVNIHERREAVALSPWVKGVQNKHISLLLQQDILRMLEPVSMALFTRVLGWDQQHVLDFLELVKRDVQDTRIHAFSEGVHVYAQKPDDALS
ncbi:S-adenosyl-L-methionine-dependent methyltransferase [Xylariaceae sp. FL0255]|nr:S-adenosyl-L-methionine-dependent methyltransferase [Xylariaceae sp. FL0255]